MKTVKKLRNKNHKTIANVETFPDGRTVFRSEDHKIIGYYDPRTNRTLDVNHHTVGYGYLLPALLDRGLLDEDQDEDVEDLDEMIEPSKPTSPEARAKSNAKSLDIQRKINSERAKSADKIADLQSKRP